MVRQKYNLILAEIVGVYPAKPDYSSVKCQVWFVGNYKRLEVRENNLFERNNGLSQVQIIHVQFK